MLPPPSPPHRDAERWREVLQLVVDEMLPNWQHYARFMDDWDQSDLNAGGVKRSEYRELPPGSDLPKECALSTTSSACTWRMRRMGCCSGAASWS